MRTSRLQKSRQSSDAIQPCQYSTTMRGMDSIATSGKIMRPRPRVWRGNEPSNSSADIWRINEECIRRNHRARCREKYQGNQNRARVVRRVSWLGVRKDRNGPGKLSVSGPEQEPGRTREQYRFVDDP